MRIASGNSAKDIKTEHWASLLPSALDDLMMVYINSQIEDFHPPLSIRLFTSGREWNLLQFLKMKLAVHNLRMMTAKASVCSSASIAECESIFEWITSYVTPFFFRSRATRLYTPLCPSIRRLVHPFVKLYFFGVYGWFSHYCSCPNAWFAYFNAPARPHTTWVAVYPAIFSSFTCVWRCWHWKKALPFRRCLILLDDLFAA